MSTKETVQENFGIKVEFPEDEYNIASLTIQGCKDKDGVYLYIARLKDREDLRNQLVEVARQYDGRILCSGEEDWSKKTFIFYKNDCPKVYGYSPWILNRLDAAEKNFTI